MSICDDSEEIKDLIKRKTKLLKDSHRLTELGDVIFQIGYLYYQKGYYKEALEEFEHALEVRKKLSVNIDIATTHRFLGETLCKLGNDFERAKTELDSYYSITSRINDLVEIQRALTTLGNYCMSLAECNYKDKKVEHLNDAYSHYLKSYDILNEISDKRLVDSKEFGLMKARTCLNCAFAMDEKRDLIICNEYLKTAIEICEINHFYEDLIRCLYIKCDQAKRKGKLEETLKVADRIVEITQKTKDYVQQSQDFAFVADYYIKVQNFEKAKFLLKKAYKLKKKCLINPEITKKLKEVINIIHLENEINILLSNANEIDTCTDETNNKLYKTYEKLGDCYCNLGLYDLGLNSYFKQLNITKKLDKTNSEIAVIYSSIAQTYQDLDKYADALKYFQLELKTFSINEESECKTLLNIALLKEKLQCEYEELKDVYMKAYEKAKKTNKISFQLKIMRLFKETQSCYGICTDEITKTINSLNEIKKMRNSEKGDDDDVDDDDHDEDNEEDIDENESLVFSSESEDDEIQSDITDEERKFMGKSTRLRNAYKKSIVKRNLRGETQLHVACIKGNVKLAKKLLEEGHPVNERDNLNWLPIHEACNYGHVEIVDMLIKHGAKINDSIGPITPLHDAAQNGHLEVCKLLLRAGALSYVFSKDGYTPLDFLCKYKEDNEKSMNQSEMALFKELYEKMLESIKGKDKNYKIKRVIYTENNIVIDETSTELDSEDSRQKPEKSYKNRNRLINDLSDLDEDTSNDNSDSMSRKKKKAVTDYKIVMCNIGSKSNNCATFSSFGKKDFNKILVSESDYNLNEKWLINDIERSGSNKRKHSNNIDDEDECDNKSKRNSYDDLNCENSNPFDDDEKDYLIYKTNKKSSKKRLVDSSSDTSNDLSERKFSNPKILSDESNFSDVVESYTNKNIAKSPFKSNKANVNIYLESDNQENDNLKKSRKEVDLTLDSPFKNSNDNRPKHKAQLKLTKMQNYPIKSFSKNTDSNEENRDKSSLKIAEKNTSSDEIMDINMKKPTNNQQSWKIKANIDNRNFLIPVSNINITIDDLINQILNRYKTIFSSDSTFREPEKVILKSSDDLILFGEDLIKDVLSDMCQVKVIIESYKNAPKLNEMYEQLCKSKNIYLYTNVKEKLSDSEESLNLELDGIFYDFFIAAKQFDTMFESIKLSSKQFNNQNDYLKSLTKIDLSSNCLNDQIASNFIDNVLFECSNLKILNLSHNLLTVKFLKSVNDFVNSTKSSLKSNLSSLESLNLSDNDFGCTLSNGYNNSDLANYLLNFLKLFQNLKELNISDCRINFSNSMNQSDRIRDDISIKNLFFSFKSSKITNIDLSFNQISFYHLNVLIESLPEYKVESLNLSNCLQQSIENNYSSSDLIRSFKIFLANSLQSISLRKLNLNLEQTSDLINSMSICKQLKYIDLSYNSFDTILIKYLFAECPKIEEARLVNSLNKKLDYESTWLEIISIKFDESNTVPLRTLELKLNENNEIQDVKNLFERRWFKNLVKINYFSKNVLEYVVN